MHPIDVRACWASSVTGGVAVAGVVCAYLVGGIALGFDSGGGIRR